MVEEASLEKVYVALFAASDSITIVSNENPHT
jgi:hypothetical protein